MTSTFALRTFVGLVAVMPPSIRATQSPIYDIVIAGGRVIDPESGLDGVRWIGINGKRITTISRTPLKGRRTIDAAGLVVAPGFIDLHAHGQDSISSRLQVQDGVTTALDLEGGTGEVGTWYAQRAGRAVINYGVAAGLGAARQTVMTDTVAEGPGAVYRSATPRELERIVGLLGRGLDEGALGIGSIVAYTPGMTRGELIRLFRLGAERGVTNFVHHRYASNTEPGSSVEAAEELIAAAAITGGAVHMVHVASTGLRMVPDILTMIEGARKRGIDITTEVYPYTAGSTDIRAALFDGDWQTRLGVTFNDIEWVATGERLTGTNFEQRRKEGGMIIAHVIPEASVDYAIAHPLVMIASDGIWPVNGRAHPRGAGTFSRILGRYVREKKTLTLMEALRKMTVMPARRLENAVPAMRNKGRIKVGADADLTVFDPARVIDRATYPEPGLTSIGIQHVMVNGTLVVRDGALVAGATPGQPIRRSVR